ncbi:MAG TPA: PAS domain S-box protein, partial [Bacteroidia bacterium]|nr:PAS domain S-box protein [Bacteroidia bacterium]
MGLKIMVNDPANTYDPLWLRTTLSLFFVAILGASFAFSWVKERIESLYTVGMTMLSGWMCLLLSANGFASEFMSGFNILSIVSILLFEDRRHMAFFTGLSTVMLLLAALTAVAPPGTVWAFVGLNVAVFAIGNIAVRARAATRTNLEISLSHLLTIQEAAVESNSDAIMLVDQEGNYLKANSAFCQMWGISQELVNGNRIQEAAQIAMSKVVHPEEITTIWNVAEGGLKIGELREIDFLDGRVVESYWRPMINEDVLIGRLWLFRDITQRRQRERQLLDNERQLRGQNERLMEFASSFVTNAGNLEASFQEITSVSADLLEVDTVGVWFFEKETGTMRMRLQFDRLTRTFTTGASVLVQDHPDYFEALFKNRVLVVNDTLKNASTQAFYKGQYSGKAAALMHAQIQAQGERIGIMSFECAKTARQWTAEDQHYAASLADLVSIAMASDQRQRAQGELTNSHAIMQAIFDLSETGIIVEDSDHNILKYNELYLKIWNMSKEFVETQPYPTL